MDHSTTRMRTMASVGVLALAASCLLGRSPTWASAGASDDTPGDGITVCRTAPRPPTWVGVPPTILRSAPAPAAVAEALAPLPADDVLGGIASCPIRPARPPPRRARRGRRAGFEVGIHGGGWDEMVTTTNASGAGEAWGSDDAILAFAPSAGSPAGRPPAGPASPSAIYAQVWEDRPGGTRPAPSIQLQPRPIGLKICTTRNAAGPTTSIVRVWAPGDAARCTRCPEAECSAASYGGALDVCHIQVGDLIPPRSAAGFSLTVWRAAGQGGAGGGVEVLPGGAGA